METLEFSGDLLRRISKMRLDSWQKAKDALVDEISPRNDMPALWQEFSLKTVAECRCRVVIRRAYRKRFGPHADVAHAETTVHKNFGRF
jgi:hypothetical protein